MTPNETRLQLAALESEARRSGCKLLWELYPCNAANLDPAIFPRGHDYFSGTLTVTAPDFYSAFSCINNETELDEYPRQARHLIQQFMRDRAILTADPHQPMLDLFSDPPTEDDEPDTPEPEDEPDTPDPWELDRTPEENGFTCFAICTAYIPYLFYGADSTGDMTDAEISLCDDFSRRWRAVDTATCHNGEPYTNEFNRYPDLSLHGYACQTEGVWCEPTTPTTPAA